MNNEAPQYFEHTHAWRRAFFELLRREQPEEIPSKGIETEFGPYNEETALRWENAAKE